MDGSVLSDTRVIEASRDWVCVRLATYEDAAEAKFLETVFRGRSGELENTVFALMAPDGKTLISRAGRSPHQVFGHGEDGIVALVEAMKEGARKYPGRTNEKRRSLPVMKDLRLSLNVAACDHLPLAVLVRDEKPNEDFEACVAALAWSEELEGRLIWSLAGSKELKEVLKTDLKPGLHLVAPDTFGLEGRVFASFAETLKTQSLKADVLKQLRKFEVKPLSHREHVQKGRRQQKDWQTEVPVTDPGVPPGGRGGPGEGPPEGGPRGEGRPHGPPPGDHDGPPPPRRRRD